MDHKKIHNIIHSIPPSAFPKFWNPLSTLAIPVFFSSYTETKKPALPTAKIGCIKNMMIPSATDEIATATVRKRLA